MNYRHDFHAGGFADIFKHLVVSLILENLTKKTTPLFYLDTHAGRPLYDLSAQAPNQTAEFETGIQLLWKARTNLSKDLRAFITLIEGYNSKELRYYPGSATIAAKLLRADDRLFINDMQPQVFQRLEEHFKSDRRAKILQEDAYATLLRLIPPKERRGLVLIDPAYEKSDEFPVLIQKLAQAEARWATGVYTVWYPIKDSHVIKKFYRDLEKLNFSKILAVEFYVLPNDVTNRLNGCGMIIINPPWQIDTQLKQLLPELQKILSPQQGGYEVIWLKNS